MNIVRGIPVAEEREKRDGWMEMEMDGDGRGGNSVRWVGRGRGYLGRG